jgi:ethanolamine utilization cobalamin adenosyltransferase
LTVPPGVVIASSDPEIAFRGTINEVEEVRVKSKISIT